MLKRGADLYQAVLSKFAELPRGRILDAGTGTGGLAVKLAAIGYEVSACDCLPESQWAHGGKIEYKRCDMNLGLPYDDEAFDYVVCLEVIEHVESPLALCRELKRVLRKGGRTMMSTPNILNMRSRVKFLLDGSFLFFNFPLIEWEQQAGGAYGYDVHIHPIRFHEFEFYLYKAGLQTEMVFTNLCSYNWRLLFPLELLIRLYSWHMIRRSHRNGRIQLDRIYAQILRDDVLFGTHLIVCGRKP